MAWRHCAGALGARIGVVVLLRPRLDRLDRHVPHGRHLLEGGSRESDVSPFRFTINDDAGYVYEIKGIYREPGLPYDNTLKAGKKVRGWLTFQVPKTMKTGVVAFADTTVRFKL